MQLLLLLRTVLVIAIVCGEGYADCSDANWGAFRSIRSAANRISVPRRVEGCARPTTCGQDQGIYLVLAISASTESPPTTATSARPTSSDRKSDINKYKVSIVDPTEWPYTRCRRSLTTRGLHALGRVTVCSSAGLRGQSLRESPFVLQRSQSGKRAP